ncbi:hypothetical protein [Chitinivibrio alkaliphilus]|uniref:Uncharacterized protein n=1 Tax=Chitinivibrio alkaliphilus ACht1 TaxID=1313304 RepID=U7DAY4_9BACT|nr:hypothetical protein [Chitinivibrio alkaliphilus]ERP31565.1 hypothetical protein CALK_1428 [Chitinivibrio alkaliphilus ACht1]
MNIRTGSKNSIENRGEKVVMTCSVCGQERKPIRVMALNAKKWGMSVSVVCLIEQGMLSTCKCRSA